jgi:hypothetical protein
MIEQLQSLMKALEAGNYSCGTYVQPEEKKMNLQFKIVDTDTGEVMHEGYVTSWRMTRNHYDETFSFDGIRAVKLEQPKKDNRIPIPELSDDELLAQLVGEKPAKQVPVLKALNNCEHHWKNYVGITQSYEYCEVCNERRT